MGIIGSRIAKNLHNQEYKIIGIDLNTSNKNYFQ